MTVSDVENVKTHSSPLQKMGSALHTDTYHCHGVPGTSAGRVYDHGFWTVISVGEAPFGMGIVVDLHAPDCKTASSSSGSSGMGLALGNGIAYSDASSPRLRLRLGKKQMTPITIPTTPPYCLSEIHLFWGCGGRAKPGELISKNPELLRRERHGQSSRHIACTHCTPWDQTLRLGLSLSPLTQVLHTAVGTSIPGAWDAHC